MYGEACLTLATFRADWFARRGLPVDQKNGWLHRLNRLLPELQSDFQKFNRISRDHHLHDRRQRSNVDRAKTSEGSQRSLGQSGKSRAFL